MFGWDRLREQIDVERSLLQQNLETFRSLLVKCRSEPPDAIEMAALAFMLQSFYTGVENILKRIAVEIDGALPEGSNWHQLLLDQMTQPGLKRPAALSEETRVALDDYLRFRHVCRHAYGFNLQWDKMAELVWGCERTMEQFQRELEAFLTSAVGRSDLPQQDA